MVDNILEEKNTTTHTKSHCLKQILTATYTNPP